MYTYNELYLKTRSILRQNQIEACDAEARYLLSAASGKSIKDLLRDYSLYPGPAVEKTLVDYIQRRLSGEPVAYITGQWEFYGLPMHITNDVLIPRTDTEVIVDCVKEYLTGRKMDARVLDLCTGSGCIGCAIAHEMPASRVVCVDISAAALDVARKNAATNRLSSRLICMQADAESSPPMGMGKFDVIVSNPPYIASEEIHTLDSSVKDYEPLWALDGGEDGYKFYKSIIKYWKSLLAENGALFFEVGEGQADRVKEMLFSAGFRSVFTRRDTIDVERVVIGIM